MRLHRFYIDKPLGEEIVVEIGSVSEQEKKVVHQWTHVFRYTRGDEVFLFSASTPGSDFLYRISEISKQKVVLSFVSLSSTTIPKPCTLVMALVKKDTFETIARQATELGVTRIIPLMASRSEKKNLNTERLLAIVTEASEQSGRGTIPEITQISSFSEALKVTEGGLPILGSLQGSPALKALHNLDQKGRELVLWVGPEGGWTVEEESLAEEKGFIFIQVTPTVLKADTAMVALLALVQTSSPQ